MGQGRNSTAGGQVGVGLIVSYRTILDNLGAVVVSAVISTVLVLLVSGWVFQLSNRKKRR